jgi:uncharacterized membrane protein
LLLPIHIVNAGTTVLKPLESTVVLQSFPKPNGPSISNLVVLQATHHTTISSISDKSSQHPLLLPIHIVNAETSVLKPLEGTVVLQSFPKPHGPSISNLVVIQATYHTTISSISDQSNQQPLLLPIHIVNAETTVLKELESTVVLQSFPKPHGPSISDLVVLQATHHTTISSISDQSNQHPLLLPIHIVNAETSVRKTLESIVVLQSFPKPHGPSIVYPFTRKAIYIH